ncbi:MAG: HupE/UreJ family protein, partial [Nannocystaceae bacterium]
RVEVADAGADATIDLRLRLPPQVDPGSGARIEPLLPATCAIARAPATDPALRRWAARCEGGLPSGARLELAGLGRDLEVVVELRRAGAPPQAAVLGVDAPAVALDGRSEGAPPPVAGYLRLGIDHILGGADHLLFVVGLVLLVLGAARSGAGRGASGLGRGVALRLVATLTAFTAAHSLTLAAATLGWIHLRQAPVEACIALSIVLLARAIVRPPPASIGRTPWGFAFACGLLHGLGFAGALAEVGLPEDAVVGALLLFNAGVELGQLAAAAVVVLLLEAARRLGQGRAAQGEPLRRLLVTALGAVAAAWTFARVAALF